MKWIKNNLLALIAIAIIAAIGIWLLYNKPVKVAYVNSMYVVENYEGMKEALAIYQKKVNQYQTNLDTLAVIYNIKSENYESKKDKISKKELEDLEIELMRLREELFSYKENVESISKEEEEKLSQGALNQINSYVEKYSKKHHIDLVIGVTSFSNVLYGNESIDITEDILDGLNKNYKK